MSKTVWILGAGFSKPLGGPLLRDLMTKHLETHLLASLGSRKLDSGFVREVRQWFEGSVQGTRHGYQERESGERVWPGVPWTNPEEFVSVVERAVGRDADELRIALKAATMHSGETLDERILQEMGSKCRNYLALACDYFVPRPKLFAALETTSPFRRWATSLGRGDTILTFNYDRVVETACGDALQVALPWQPVSLEPSEAPRLFKLHGSVTFQRDPASKNESLETSPSCVFDALEKKREFVIGVPGPSKLLLATTWEPYWKAAEDALSDADSIILVGYRFAESDHEAKRRILGAMQRNGRPNLTVFVVLGHGIPGNPGERVSKMITWVLDRRDKISNATKHNITTVPMFTEDFLAVFDHSDLDRGSSRPIIG